jgi:general stress protein 26
MEKEEIIQTGLELIESSKVAYLTTVDRDGLPQTRAVFNLKCKDMFPLLMSLFREQDNNFVLYFTTNTSSEKIAQIKGNKRVCVYFCQPEEIHGVMLSGEIEIVNDSQFKNALWQDGWERFYPAGPGDPDYSILQFKPAKIKGWYKSQPFATNLSEE